MIRLPDFFEFLSIPTISSEPAYKEQVKEGAMWVKRRLEQIGFHTSLWEGAGHPIVYGKSAEIPGKPTLLIYNHYDVQPVDPLELWESPPFEPTVRDGQVFARGAQDNKGQCFYVLEALRHLKDIHGGFPINIKVCIEGEEECGSTHLSKTIPGKNKELKADYLAIVDLGIPSLKEPAITLGTRGLVTFDLEVIGSSTDLHSGSHGGVAYNPLFALCQLLAEAKSPSGKIMIPGFYDSIVPTPEEVIKALDLTFDKEQYHETFAIYPTGGEKECSPLENLWLKPTFEINGLSGGYSGKGFKTVIPAKASAKLSCRLVPGQDPTEIGLIVKNYFEKKSPGGLKVKVEVHFGKGAAVRTSPHFPPLNR
jgi:acetylornithine deacetylase/succinyl-diaminopimelate desuccinylase-like protein